MLSESTPQLNGSAQGARVGTHGQKPAGLYQDWLPFKGSVSFIFGFPGKFVENLRKQNKIPKMGFSWVSLSLERKQSLWSEHLPKPAEVHLQLTEIVLVHCLMQWNVAQVFVIAVSIKGGNKALPLAIKCFHVNGNECYRGLFLSECTGERGAEGLFSLYH